MAIDLSSELKEWLDVNAKTPDGKRTRFLLPVYLQFADAYRLEFSRTVVAVSPEQVEQALELKLEDGAMGVSLMDSVLKLCPEGQTSCVVWLEGYWGHLLEMPPGVGTPTGSPFSVLRVDHVYDTAGDAPLAVRLQDD